MEKGFFFQDKKVPLIGPQGIFKPAILPTNPYLPLSINTSPNSPYDDKDLYGGVIAYKYRGEDQNHYQNVGLREAMKRKTPLIYFRGLAEGYYSASWPVFIVADNPKELTFMAKVDKEEFSFVSENASTKKTEDLRRSYATYEAHRRVHQGVFRTRVLIAYKQHCAICYLGHPPLLDAAHILPDTHPNGHPTVDNGISLCRIHHAAYDTKIIGIRPDYHVEVNEAVLMEKDGPMLKHGLQEFHESKLILPRSKSDWPKEENLEERYQQFKAG